MEQTFFHLQIFWWTTPQGGMERKKLMKDWFREIFHIFQGLEYATRNQKHKLCKRVMIFAFLNMISKTHFSISFINLMKYFT